MSDSYLTPFLYPYTTVGEDADNAQVTVVGDMPILV